MLATILAGILSLQIGPEPIAIGYIPNSILANPPKNRIQYQGSRTRYPTCSGVTWCDNGQHLLTANFLSGSLHLFSVDLENQTLQCLRRFDKSLGVDIDSTESVSFSNDKQLLAVSNMLKRNVSIHRWESVDKPIEVIGRIRSEHPHSSAFSPCDNYLAITEIRGCGGIRICRISENEGRFAFKQTQLLVHKLGDCTPKDIAFTFDGKFAIVGYCRNAQPKPRPVGAFLISYRFDSEKGRLDPKPVDRIDVIDAVEGVGVLSDSSVAFTTDTVNDRICAHEFDPETGKFGETWIVLESPRAELSFPHGLSVSSDDRYLAVTNFGDDKITIYEITRK